jgi:predicted nicotinamide N-methyase
VNDVVEERIVVAGRAFSLQRPTDPEALLDEEAFGDDEFLPYWAELWPSSIALARVVGGLDLRGAGVLELGCGLALPSLVAAACGGSVVATDWSEDAVALVAQNAAANALAVRGERLRWSDPRALDGMTFDLVMAADVLYESRNTAPLLGALGRLVHPEGEALVADPGRRHAAGFAEAARSAGWRVEASEPPGLARGRLYRLRRPLPGS